MRLQIKTAGGVVCALAAMNLWFTACATDEDVDGADDTFLTGGKSDVGGVEEGSTAACGVLAFANTADFHTMNKVAKVNKQAVNSIFAFRAGPDGTAGTVDDRTFASLAELDAVKWVGPVAFAKLYAYSAAHGYACEFPPVELQLLSISDWHGQLDAIAAPTGNIGGAAVLATYFQQERAANPNTLTLTAGDAFGATPPLASFFEERTAVLAENLMGLSADGLGNHNFDRGVDHLATMIELAQYPLLSANLTNVDDNMTCPSKPGGHCIRPYTIFTVGGVKVAVIGLTNPDAVGLTKPGSFGTIEVTDPVLAALAARSDALAEGAQITVVIAHMGATSVAPDGTATGPLIDFASMVTGFDVILGDHTNLKVNTVINGATVIENLSAGATYARVRLSVNKFTGAIVSRTAELVSPVVTGITPDPAVDAMLAPYRTELAAAFDGVIATTSDVFARGANVERLREMPIGNLVTDAMRLRYGTQLGFTNGGGLRAPLPSSYAPMNTLLRRTGAPYVIGPPYDLVVGDVYTLLPFGNAVATRTVTGAQLWLALEHAVSALPAANGWFAQISGFRFDFDSSLAAGGRVLSVTLDDGTPILADGTSYTMATSDFIDVRERRRRDAREDGRRGARLHQEPRHAHAHHQRPHRRPRTGPVAIRAGRYGLVAVMVYAEQVGESPNLR